MPEHLVGTHLLHVQDLAAQGEDGLEAPVAPLLCRAARAVALDDEDLRLVGITRGAVGELAGQSAAFERTLAVDQVAGLARRFPRPRSGDALLDDAAPIGGVLFQVLGERLGQDALHLGSHFHVSQPRLRLAFELGLGQLHRNHRHEPFAHVVAAQVGILVFQNLRLARIVVEDACQGRAEACQVAAAVDCVDGVGEGEDGLVEPVVVLDGALDDVAVDLALHVDGFEV